MTGDDDAPVIPPWGASWAGARAACRPRLWFRGYRGRGRDRLLAGPAGELLTQESADWAGSGRGAVRVPGRRSD